MKSTPTSSAARHYQQTARAQAAEETGQRIIDAFLAKLMTQWFDEITLDAVAAEADVTVQTVIRRFGSKEGLLATSLRSMGEQINARREAPAGGLDRLIGNLLDDYEHTGDAVLRLLALEPRHAFLKEFLDYGRREHRQSVSRLFVPTRLTGAAREQVTDMLVVATDVYTWKLLRRDMGKSVAATKAAIKTLVTGVLTQH